MLVKCAQSDYKDQCADWSWAALKHKVLPVNKQKTT